MALRRPPQELAGPLAADAPDPIREREEPFRRTRLPGREHRGRDVSVKPGQRSTAMQFPLRPRCRRGQGRQRVGTPSIAGAKPAFLLVPGVDGGEKDAIHDRDALERASVEQGARHGREGAPIGVAGGLQDMAGAQHEKGPVAAPLFEARPESVGRLPWIVGGVQGFVQQRRALEPCVHDRPVVGPRSAAPDQPVPLPAGQAADRAFRVELREPVPRRHRPRAQLGKATDGGDVDQTGRWRPPFSKPVRERGGKRGLKGFERHVERPQLVLEVRNGTQGAVAPEDARDRDAVAGLDQHQRASGSVRKFERGGEVLHARAVRQGGEETRRTARGAHHRVEAAPQPGLAQGRIQQRTCGIRRHPVPDERHERRQGGLHGGAPHPPGEAAGGRQANLGGAVQQPVEGGAAVLLLVAPRNMLDEGRPERGRKDRHQVAEEVVQQMIVAARMECETVDLPVQQSGKRG